MIKLIKGELKKILHKKSIYIITIVFVFFAILTNIIYKEMDDLTFEYSKEEIEELKQENETYDLTNSIDLEYYISNLVTIETYELKETYNNSSSEYMIDNFYSELLYNLYESLYLTNDLENYNYYQELQTKYLEAIENDNWEYFNNLEITQIKELLNSSNDNLTTSRLEELLSLKEYRITNNVSYDSNNYLHQAIISIEENLYEYYNLKNVTEMNDEEKNYFQNIEKEYLTNWYVLNNQEDINSYGNLSSVLTNFADEFGLFILIYVILITGSIVSEEFNKGTIKYLLTKPYKRSKILTSKLLAVLILVPILILIMILIEIIIGGLILGFNSITSHTLIYNALSHSVTPVPVLIYLVKMLLAILPMYLVLGVASFMLSTLTSSTSAAITITFLIYFIGNVISGLASIYNLKIFKLFISLHWDFTYLVKLESHPFNMSTSFSCIMVFIYVFIMLFISYLFFNKKDVKNI